MEMPISQMMDPTGETNKAVSYTNIRIMQVTNTFATSEQDELSSIATPWSQTTSQNVPGFSALCLMFGERMSDSLGNTRPIGLIDSTWGGTRIESWISTSVTSYCNTPPDNSANQNGDHNLWNAMIKPLTNFAVRGAIWYQGESNTGYNQDYYPCHIQRMVQDWRNKFVNGIVEVPNENGLKFPFGIVQIGPYSGGGDSSYGILRFHQTVEQGVLPNLYIPESFFAASYDTTDPTSPTGDIHPRDKPTVATRLANSAKSLLYRESWSQYGPKIGPYSGGGDSSYGILRFHQTVEQGVLPNLYIPESFFAASYDTTDPTSPTGDIHPRDKPTVATRLANSAKSLLYRESWSQYGPKPDGIVFGIGTATITYDRNIIVSGTTGFSALVGTSWVDATITSSTARTVTVTMDSTATKLAYAWKGVVCDYKACSIYSNDSEALPAQVWRWDVVNSNVQ
ncbi:hypothetical protein B566_EDAN003624 [Ephemera danica]|nr:hypothetical protein B566_EDAN003624 [Ephemera danica]